MLNRQRAVATGGQPSVSAHAALLAALPQAALRQHGAAAQGQAGRQDDPQAVQVGEGDGLGALVDL